MTRILTLAAFVLALAGGWFWWSQQATTPGVTLGSLNAQEAAEVDTSTVEEMALGDENAPLTVIEYASYTCPHCRTFNEEVMPQLKAEYIDTGKVRLVYREVYFDPFGLWASLVARCGADESENDERFFAITDLLYENQADWLGNGDRAAVAENLRTLGRSAGLSNEQIDACLSDEAKARALVASYQQNATADDIDSTPSFVIDGTKYSNMPWDEMKSILDEKLAG